MWAKGNKAWKKRKRVREVSFEKIEDIKEHFKFKNQDIADLLDVSLAQYNNYRKSYAVPSDRYIALTNAIRQSIEQEAQERRKQLDDILGIDY